MIIVKLKAGLGNQMFQYACGRALALRNNDVLKLDALDCMKDTMILWRYRLGHYKIVENFASKEEVACLQFPRGKLSEFYFKLRTKAKLFNIGYMSRVKHKKGDYYLNGFWQTEKYFDDFGDQIAAELTLKEPMGEQARVMAEKIMRSSPSISIHLRRADYANDKATNKIYGTCDAAYYSRALAYVVSKLKDKPKLFVFSDDINWVKENMPMDFETTYVSAPGIPDHEELALMSLCENNIIANSTFSWWGAWLNKNKKKIVVAPKKWIRRNNFIHRNTVPKSWVRI